jgi:hypothetical protein
MKYPLILSLLLCFSSKAQESNFPQKWIGEYTGNMVLANAHRTDHMIKVDFTMEELIEDSLCSYHMRFYGESTIVKDYLIRAVSKDNKVDYLLDENNGIIMELTYMNSGFYGMYEVMGMIYTSTLRKQGDDIFYELYAAPTENPYISGTEATEQEEAIEVKSTKPMLVQSVVLTRKS